MVSVDTFGKSSPSCSNFTQIVIGIRVFEAKRTNGPYLCDVFPGFCPVEAGRVANSLVFSQST
jgi:hypothetical protein